MDKIHCLKALSECENINVQTAQLVTHQLKPILLKEVQTEYGYINKNWHSLKGIFRVKNKFSSINIICGIICGITN